MKSDDIKFTRAFHRMRELDRLGLQDSEEYSKVTQDFIEFAPPQSRAEILKTAIAHNFMPAPTAVSMDGQPLWSVQDVASFYGLSLIEAEKRLNEVCNGQCHQLTGSFHV